MSYTLKFKRGDKAKSMREGVVGTVVGYIEILGSERMWVLDVPMSDDKRTYVGECHTITVDESELVFVSAGEAEYSAEFPVDFKFSLGTVVKHAYLKEVEGMIMSRRCHANGCFHYRMVLPTVESENKKVRDAYFPEAVLQGDNVVLPFMAEQEKEDTAKTSDAPPAAKGKKGGPREVVSKRMDW